MGRRRSFAGVVAVVAGCLSGLMATMCPSNANAADHISITREVFIDAGVASDEGVGPEAIVRTGDGGYVIAGRNAGRAGAVRVDTAGVVKWRYSLLQFKAGAPIFHGAAMLPDDSVILCGSVDVPGDNGAALKGLGLIAHIDRTGRVISETAPQSDEAHHSFFGFSSCSAVGNEVVLVGKLVPHLGVKERKLWLVVLDGSGSVKYQTVVTDVSGDLVHVMPNSDLVMMSKFPNRGSSSFEATRLVVMDTHGNIKADHNFPLGLMPVASLADDSKLHFVWRTRGDVAHLITLDNQLNSVSEVEGTEPINIIKRGYVLADGSLILFGGQQYEGDSFTASVVWLSRDLKQRQVLVVGKVLSSNTIVDAVPTGKPGEFATVRSIYPTHALSLFNEKRLGAMLTFVQVR